MRTPNLGSVQYTPGQVPEDAADMRRFLFDELARLKAAIDALRAGHLDIQTVAPAKPRDGDIRYADGVNWKPNGTGSAGPYWYNGVTNLWVAM